MHLSNKRIFAFADPYHWSDILATIRELRPGQIFPDDFRGLPRDPSTLDNDLGEGIPEEMVEPGWLYVIGGKCQVEYGGLQWRLNFLF